MTIKCWKSFHKPPGSTKVPTGGTALECEAPTSVDIRNPVVTLTSGIDITYVYIPALSRYYFVNTVVHDRGFDRLYLTLDELASNRTAIMDYTGYVTRAAQQSAWNNDIADGLYPSCGNTLHEISTTPNPYSGGESYIVQIDGYDGAKTYHMSKAVYDGLCSVLWQAFEGAGLAEAVKYLAAPTDNIRAVYRTFYPVSGAESRTIHIGWQPYTINCADVTGKIRRVQSTFSIPRPLDNRSKHSSRYSLSIPGAGTVEISKSSLWGKANLTVAGQLNMDTGTVLYRVYAGNPTETQTYICDMTGNFALPALTVLQNVDLAGMTSSAMQGLASAGMGNALGVASGIISGISSLVPAYSSVGACSDWAGMDLPITLDCAYQEYPDEDIAHRGRPSCKNLRLGSLSGYVQVADPGFSGAPTMAENEVINSWMERGVFLE